MTNRAQDLVAVRSDPSPEPPYEGFDGEPFVQLCQALRQPEVRDRLGMGALCFDQLAWAPRVGDRLLSETQVERVRERFALYAARHGQPKWRGTLDEVRRAIWLVADENPLHPIAQRLCELRWDGVSRLARVATDILGVDAERAPHAAQLVRKWFLSTVARAFRPGCPADTVLTLVGEELPPPSLFFRLLVPPAELVDAPHALDSDDMAGTLRSAWVCLHNELPLLAEKDSAAIAAFLSRREDAVPAHERAPRTTVFVAAVAAMPELPDESIRRRFRVVPIGKMSVEKLVGNEEQLWAEATVEYLAGATWRLTPEEEIWDAKVHRQRSDGDPWEAPLLDYMSRSLDHDDDIKGAPSMAKILADVFRIQTAKIDVGASMRVGRILRRHGFRRRQIRRGGGRVHVWYPDWLEDDGSDDVVDER